MRPFALCPGSSAAADATATIPATATRATAVQAAGAPGAPIRQLVIPVVIPVYEAGGGLVSSGEREDSSLDSLDLAPSISLADGWAQTHERGESRPNQAREWHFDMRTQAHTP